ncbi:2-hydroxymuconic semialdehyde dehydrogenase [Nannocystis radixulma]|uniref:2-hydroxymuconic semialdehyde dehydrogenase n=1 Tax=Nannocystis radixulma TaxID=2995305 RepID=A0ABT5AZM2_9BACT|nr:2-hydroxymuconic semialdehyde dehydrogenase [Nannocystis radixulma]MDC0666276.1 2-hydroxymuconic semialdehyde dehydrogenase [Nannocystis radixulma]
MRHFFSVIANEVVADGPTFEVHDPATGRVHALAHEATPAIVDRAVEAARAALRGPWGRMPATARLTLLRRIADAIDARFDDLVATEVHDTGMLAGFARRVAIPRGAESFRVFADLAQSLMNECFETPTPEGAGALNYTLRRPAGVVAAICPWNLPLLMLTWKVAPALAMGNTVVVKPSEETPGTATLLAELMAQAGLPPGVFNVVHGGGAGSTGAALASHPGVDAITFTGECATGRAIRAAAAPSLNALCCELGGKNPALVFADADLDAAVAGCARSTFANTGQVCLCTERIYVERPLFTRFVAALTRAARALKAGDPFAPDTTLGPVISADQRARVLEYYRQAQLDGAEVLTGGGIPELPEPWRGGSFIEPTLWTGLSTDSRCLQDEVFGPVAHIAPFDGEEEAIALANESRYGLAATVWSRDGARTMRVAASLEVGTVWCNGWLIRDLRAPFAGMKQSGVGREGGRHALEFFSRVRNVCIQL